MATIQNIRDQILHAADVRIDGTTVGVTSNTLVFKKLKNGAGYSPTAIGITASPAFFTAPSYQWSYKNSGTETWTTISGATSQTLNIQALDYVTHIGGLVGTESAPAYVQYRAIVSQDKFTDSIGTSTSIIYMVEQDDIITIECTRPNASIQAETDGTPLNYDSSNSIFKVKRGNSYLTYNSAGSNCFTVNSNPSISPSGGVVLGTKTGSGTLYTVATLSSMASATADVTWSFNTRDESGTLSTVPITYTQNFAKLSNGSSAVKLDLTNQNYNISTEFDGTGNTAISAVTVGQAILYVGETTASPTPSFSVSSDGVNFSTSKILNGVTCTIGVSTGTYALTIGTGQFSADSSVFTIRATYGGVNYHTLFTVKKLKNGAPNSQIWLDVTTDALSKASYSTAVAGAYSPSTIYLRSKNTTGSTTVQDNNYYVTYAVNGGADAATRTAGAFTLAASSIASTNVSYISSRLYDALTAGNLIDSEDIPIVLAGTPGANSYRLDLSNENHTVPTDSDGSNGNYTTAKSYGRVYEGATLATGWGFSSAVANCSASLAVLSDIATITVTTLTADIAYVDLTATKSGYSDVTARFSLARDKSGISYYITPHVDAAVRGIDGVVAPTNVTYSAYSLNVGGVPSLWAGGTIYTYTSNNGTSWATVASKASVSSHTVPANVTGALFVRGALFTGSTFLDAEVVPILEDGPQGPTGVSGATGATGAKAAVAYFVTSTGAMPSAPSIAQGFTPTASAAVTSTTVANWYTQPKATLVPGEWMFEAAGTYDNTSYTWVTQSYLATFKVGQLSALSATMGSLIVNSTLSMPQGGSIYSSNKTAYENANAGFFIGYSGSTPVLDIGDSSNYLRWSGTALTVSGQIVSTSTFGGTQVSTVLTNLQNASTTAGTALTTAGRALTTAGNAATTAGNAAITAGNAAITAGAAWTTASAALPSANFVSTLESNLSTGINNFIANAKGSTLTAKVNAANVVLQHVSAAPGGTSSDKTSRWPALGVDATGIYGGFNQTTTGTWINTLQIKTDGSLYVGNNTNSGLNFDSSGKLTIGTGVIISASGTALFSGTVGSAAIISSTINSGAIISAQVTTATLTGALVTAGTVTGSVVSGGTVSGALVSGGVITGSSVTVTGNIGSGSTITGAVFSTGTTGKIIGNKTGYTDDTNGYYLGYDTSAYKLYIGSSTGYIKWTGTALDIKGNIGSGSTITGAVVSGGTVTGALIIGNTVTAGALVGAAVSATTITGGILSGSTLTGGLVIAGSFLSSSGTTKIQVNKDSKLLESYNNGSLVAQFGGEGSNGIIYGIGNSTSHAIVGQSGYAGIAGIRGTATTGYGILAFASNLSSNPIAIQAQHQAGPIINIGTNTSQIDLSFGTVYGIKFPSGSPSNADVNTLDDYEEGSWTPTLVPGAGSITPNASYRLGTYTKIGNMVTVQGQYYASSVSTPSGTLFIAGLPFATKNTTNMLYTGSIWGDSWLNIPGAPQIQSSANSTTIEVSAITLNGGRSTNIANSVQAGTRLVFSMTYQT